jgi:hypothetical protein
MSSNQEPNMFLPQINNGNNINYSQTFNKGQNIPSSPFQA